MEIFLKVIFVMMNIMDMDSFMKKMETIFGENMLKEKRMAQGNSTRKFLNRSVTKAIFGMI